MENLCKVRICYVVTVPLTIRSFFIPQLKFLAKNGFDVTVICSPDERLQSEVGDQIKYVPIDIPRGIYFAGSIYAIKKLKIFFDKNHFDVVQYSTPNAAFYASIAAKAAGIPVRNYHIMGFRYLGARGAVKMILKNMERIICHNSTSIECVSKSNMDLGIKDYIFPREKAAVVWNGSSGGVDLIRFDIDKRNEYRSQIRSKLEIREEEFVFGFVGRLTRDKGVNEILNAYSHLRSGRLIFVGPSEGIETLDQKLYQKSLKDPGISYIGYAKDIEKYYSAFDCLLLPSYREGFGNVIIEAAAMGTPAIVSNIPGPVDAIIPEKTAFLVPAQNSRELQKAMERAMAADVAQMGRTAAQYVRESFDSKELCSRILNRKMDLLNHSF